MGEEALADDRTHVDEAETEGVAFLFETEPVSVTRDADGRIRISLNDGRTLDADVVVAALDRKVDLDALEAMKLPLAKKGFRAFHFLVITSGATASTAFYIDDLDIRFAPLK